MKKKKSLQFLLKRKWDKRKRTKTTTRAMPWSLADGRRQKVDEVSTALLVGMSKVFLIILKYLELLWLWKLLVPRRLLQRSRLIDSVESLIGQVSFFNCISSFHASNSFGAASDVLSFNVSGLHLRVPVPRDGARTRVTSSPRQLHLHRVRQDRARRRLALGCSALGLRQNFLQIGELVGWENLKGARVFSYIAII